MNRVKKIIGHLDEVNKSSPQSCVATTIPREYGGALVADILKHEGVTTVFTLTGGHIAPILVGCNQSGIRVIDVRDEVTTVFAADAVSRVTGIPGIAIVTAGPGLTNTITAVKNAQMAESALIVMGGATSMLLKGRGSLQDIDQFALMRPHVKCCFSIKKVKDIIPTLQRAFYISKNGIPGPVFVEFPLETIWPESMTRETTQNQAPAKLGFSTNQLLAYMAEKYVDYHIRNVFSGEPFDNSQSYLKNKPSNNVRSLQYVSNFPINQVKSVLNWLNSQDIEKPLIVLGSQAVFHPNLINQLIESLEYLEIPVYLSGMARGLLGKSHPLHKRHKRSVALKKCDLVILCGVSCDFRLDYGRGVNKRAKFIMVNLDESKLKNNSDLRRRDLTIYGDSQAFILRLSETAKNFNLKFTNKFNEWNDFLNKNELKREKEIEKMRIHKPISASSALRKDDDSSDNSETNNARTFCDPIFTCQTIDSVLDDDSYIIADGGDFVGTASYIVRPRAPLRWLDPGAFGTLGCGAGFAMGVKAMSPKSEVWILFGDGSFGWSMSEFDTMVRNKLPVIAVIGNDACWQQMYRDQIRLLKDDVATLLNYANYHECVKGLGCKGIVVENESQLKPALLKAKEYAKEGHAVVVNVLLAKSKFREGSISL